MKFPVSFLVFTFIFSSFFAQEAGKNQPTSLTKDFFQTRRSEIRDMMPPRSVGIFFSSVEKVRSNDVNFHFHQDPDFYYLTGLKEPDALLMIFKEGFELNGDTLNEVIFVPGRSVEHEIWHGKRLGTVGVKEELGFEFAYTNTSFADQDLDFNYFDHVLINTPDGVICDDPSFRGDLASMRKHLNFKLSGLEDRVDNEKLESFLEIMREIKSDEELQLIQKAINITCNAHKRVMQDIDTTYTEYKAEALIEFVFRDEGADGPGFPSIVGGGENTCVLHYVDNNAALKNGDLLVMDIGAEYEMYSADITRTIPVNGSFSEEQKIIYELVLKAQKAGIEKCRAGNKFWDPHVAATEVIQKGLRNLGIIKKSYQARNYFMHGTSHYLGLDVHDAGSYQPLKERNVITVEPGIYIPIGSDCDEKWWNIGIRIEDDVLITNGDPVVLSDCAPREVSEVEQVMQK